MYSGFVFSKRDPVRALYWRSVQILEVANLE